MADETETGAARVVVLPESLANQIAAGEVVERPASVVKELVENAIDAGAGRILIDLEEAGRGLIRVVDDGSGMSPEDARTAILRHATSKLTSAEGLAAIDTLGFRGEALPSIASVSRFTLVTRRQGDETTTRITIEGGSEPQVSVAASPVGTRVEVRDLFWNVPARLKFLKSAHTETHHVVELVKGFALGYPHIHFRLGTGRRAALDFPAVRKLVERVSQVLGRATGRRLYEVSLDGEYAPHKPIRVSGFVSSAREAKATQSGMTLFVNGRRVKDRTLAHAVVSAFGSELAPGRFPQAVLWVHIGPEELDVNVHPTKAEVRFRQPSQVHDAVKRAIQTMLIKRPWILDEPLPLERHALGPQTTQAAPATLFDRGSPAKPAVAAPPHRTELRFESRASPVPLATRSSPTRDPGSNPASPPKPKAGGTWRYLARLKAEGGAVLVEGREGLGLFDPEAVHTLMTQTELDALHRPIPSQPLLLPARLELTAAEAQRLEPRLAMLNQLGIDVEPFGGTTHQLLGLPAPALGASPGVLLAELAALGPSEVAEMEVIRLVARVTARSLCARGLDERQLAGLVEFVPRALAARHGVLLLTHEEIARRLRPKGGAVG